MVKKERLHYLLRQYLYLPLAHRTLLLGHQFQRQLQLDWREGLRQSHKPLEQTAEKPR